MEVNNTVQELFEKHIKGTAKDAIVADVTIFLCHLTYAVSKNNNFPPKVYLKTRALKHIYDKRPAEEFDRILIYLKKLVRYPDCVYKNKNPKRGDYVFTKTINGEQYLCSLELYDGCFNIATVFRLRKKNYIKSYDLLWSWRDGAPSS
ncbi:MAG: hypothetical protein WCV59_04670 [Parcubacteria group bacterium]|jgi:hypothetical protein